MPLTTKIQKLYDALDTYPQLNDVKQLINSSSISIGEINALNHTDDSALHKLLTLIKSNIANPSITKKYINIIKFLIESGVKYDVALPNNGFYFLLRMIVLQKSLSIF